MNTTSNSEDQPIESTVDRLAQQAHETVDKVAHSTKGAAENLSERGYELKGQQEEWLSTVSDYVQDNPITALGIAAAGGFLLSRVLSGR